MSDAQEREPLPTPPNKRVKTPTLLQMEAVECGAAALGIILAYHGRIVPLEELRMECGVSRDGSKATNVLKAARKYGMVAKGFKYSELSALYELDLPIILFWNLNHFLVLEGFRRGKVFLNDPATGPRTITLEELDASYSGVVLTFEPSETFEPGGSKPSLWSALRRRLEGNERALVFAVLCGLFLVIPGLVIPTFSRFFIDEVLVRGQDYFLRPLILGMLITAGLRMALTWLQEYYLLRLETKIALVNSREFFHHILHLPISYFSQRYAGEIGNRVHINNKVANVVAGKLAAMGLDTILIVFYAFLMLMYDVVLTVVCVGISMINVVAMKLVARHRVDSSRRLLQEEGKLMGTAMNGLRMIETLKASGGEAEFFSRWSGYQAKSLKAEQKLGQITEYVNAVPPLLTAMTTGIILWLGSLKVMDESMTIGMLVAYQSLMSSFAKPLDTFVSFGGEIQELEGDMNRLDDVLRYPKDPQFESAAAVESTDLGMRGEKLTGLVELRDVKFGYNPLEAPLIDDFNLTVQPGQRVALVGMSGSGKSTILNLITGLYQPWDGGVLFDGRRRDEIAPRVMANSLAVVDQDIFLFGGSISENITLWDTTISSTRVSTASRDAEIEEVILARTGTYNGPVEEGGTNFSGGQRQRLEIARSLVGNPSILVLDEATSALDPTTEALIDSALRRRGCTCIIVAHRLSTIRDADEIIVMDRGKIVQRGTHDELKNQKGLYAYLIEE